LLRQVRCPFFRCLGADPVIWQIAQFERVEFYLASWKVGRSSRCMDIQSWFPARTWNQLFW